MLDASVASGSTPNMIQELPWTQSLQAIKESAGFADFAAFREHLEQRLPFNSAYTRERYAQTILKYLFPGGSLDTLTRRAWATYHDDVILEDLARYQLMGGEPTLARFVLTRLAPLPPGSVIGHDLLEDFIHDIDPKARSKMVNRLGVVLRRIGLIVREHQQDVVAQLKPARTSFLILIHHLLAPTPRIVTVSEIVGAPFWRYLGYREEETIRRILHEASAQGLIARYATVDQLEQITTRYTLDQWFTQALRL
jgi:hypothetical protein